jgi:hypothetical protein
VHANWAFKSFYGPQYLANSPFTTLQQVLVFSFALYVFFLVDLMATRRQIGDWYEIPPQTRLGVLFSLCAKLIRAACDSFNFSGKDLITTSESHGMGDG